MSQNGHSLSGQGHAHVLPPANTAVTYLHQRHGLALAYPPRLQYLQKKVNVSRCTCATRDGSIHVYAYNRMHIHVFVGNITRCITLSATKHTGTYPSRNALLCVVSSNLALSARSSSMSCNVKPASPSVVMTHANNQRTAHHLQHAQDRLNAPERST